MHMQRMPPASDDRAVASASPAKATGVLKVLQRQQLPALAARDGAGHSMPPVAGHAGAGFTGDGAC